MLEYVTGMLQCPDCAGELSWNIHKRREHRIWEATAECKQCGGKYPVREGIGVFLVGKDWRKEDLWAQLDSELLQYLQANPETEHLLMKSPVETLKPADQFFRARILEERGDFDAAKKILDKVDEGIYTQEYLDCYQRQMEYILDALGDSEGPLVDLASGRGGLVEQELKRHARPMIVSDLSPSVLQRDRKWLEHFELYDGVSLLAFDARHTPFKNRAIGTLTTNQGLANIRQPEGLLKELRRVVGGSFLATSLFYDPEDEANAGTINELHLDMLFRENAVESFRRSGWKLSIENACIAHALPTPNAELLEGAGIDGLPVAATELEWATLVAR
jgi:uncharacterized protein YbaR (Trm112 family)